MGHAEDVEQGLKTFSMAKPQDIQKMLIKSILAVNDTLKQILARITPYEPTTHLLVQDDEGDDEPGPPRDYFKGE